MPEIALESLFESPTSPHVHGVVPVFLAAALLHGVVAIVPRIFPAAAVFVGYRQQHTGRGPRADRHRVG